MTPPPAPSVKGASKGAQTPRFVHLHTHSAYSLSEGAMPVSRLRDVCLEMKMPALAVTDTNNLFGALEVSEVLSGAGVQPITGLQQAVLEDSFGVNQDRHQRPPSLVLLAQNETGYGGLMKISSQGFLHSVADEGACVDFAYIAQHHEGIICLTGGYDGPVDRLLRDGRFDEAKQALITLKDSFAGRLYVELQRHEGRDTVRVEQRLIDLAYELEIPLVACNEPYFSTPKDHEAHDALLCIAAGAYVHQEDRRQVTPDHYFKSADEMCTLFADLPEATANSVEIAKRCAYRPLMRDPILPNFLAGAQRIKNDENDQDGDDRQRAEMDALETLARDGLEARLKILEATSRMAQEREAYFDRLKIELDIINGMGFPGYFLIVADFIQWAKGKDIPVGPGRGSGAGSVVAWALTITDLDPLRFGLLFERFLNPERVSMPDFDVDFCQDRRDEVIRYVQEKYGEDRVAQIITFGKLQARAVLRDVGRVLNMPFGQIDRLCKLVPNNPANPVTLGEAIETEPRLKEEQRSDEGVAALMEKALKLEGLYRHASTHAAGVVIGDRPLDELVALYLDPRSDMPATQFNMKWVEPAGLVKFDFLGLKTLTVIDRAIKFIKLSRDEDVDIATIPIQDDASFAMLGEGHATGVFQLESAGMRSTLKSMKPDSLEDIIALVSLYRPGPMENIPTYIDRKQGRQEPDYLHPKLEGVLKETYGVIIYQEQVMQIAQILSGYSLGEADLLRRAMGKKKKEEMDKQRKRFVDGALERGVDGRQASSIFDLVAKFAGYGFNKSHAAAYALIAYQTAYLKANYPAEFLAASMSLDRTNTDKLSVFVKEARRADIGMLAPHINHSEADFSVKGGAVVYALSAVKNVGEAAMAHIVEMREKGEPFVDLYDFAERVDLKMVGKRAMENLARAGAFEGLCASREQGCNAADLLIKISARHHEEQSSDQGGLFQLDSAPVLDRPSLPVMDDWMPMDLLTQEFKAIGFYFSGHPLDAYETELKRLKVMKVSEADEAFKEGDSSFQFAGVVRSVKVRRSKSGNPFAWVELSDASGEYEVTVFSKTLEPARDLLEVGALLLVSVSADESDSGDVRFIAEAIAGLDIAAANTASQIKISLSSIEALESIKKRLNSVKPANRSERGQVILAFQLPDSGREVELLLAEEVAATVQMKSALKDVEGVFDVELL